MLLMASIIFKVKGKTKPSAIHIRFTHGRNIDFWRSTSLQINPDYWGNGKVKNLAKNSEKINLQNKLIELEKTIIDSFNEVYYNGDLIKCRMVRKCY